ncbi:hypothetical protein MIND_00023400 [Mycena indigotica]|uniref:MFS general substrate transporter n=1 Tax=Mycena indigotica TaxID=2126181 RepID=A0A8H6WER7_9AGAR|nr:uncharacterized protein MIND_00023400 [Mycena indigotica]KAF7315092.1 hypothetical protein MIND_00023400 [Mycena indigotica]
MSGEQGQVDNESFEKGFDEQGRENSSSRASEHVSDFGGESLLPAPPSLTQAQARNLYRKLDIRIMPVLALMYLFSFLDRGFSYPPSPSQATNLLRNAGNIGNARIQGLESQLDLTGNKFNIALTMFFIPYCIFECPANMVLKKFRPSRWLPGITVVWGIIMTLMSLVKTYPQLVGTRVLLGIAEAGLFPGVVYYLTLWYPRHMLQWRVGIFFGAASLAGAFGGTLAFGISFMGGTRGLLAWSWIFMLEGIGTVVVGILAYLGTCVSLWILSSAYVAVLVDFPVTATFLKPEERSYIVWRRKQDILARGEEEHFEMRHFWEAVTDWQVWVHMLVYMSVITNRKLPFTLVLALLTCPSQQVYGITLFLPTIISTFGHSPAVSNLLTVPPYVCATIVLFIFAYSSDRLKLRFPFILAGFCCNLIGFSINISDAPSGVKYFGTFFCVTGAYAAVPGIVAWTANNLSGEYKRAIGTAIQIGIGHFGAVFASNMYRTQDKPRFIVGHGCELMFVALGLISTSVAVFLSHRENRKRDAIMAGSNEKSYSQNELRKMGDRAPDFRYML